MPTPKSKTICLEASCPECGAVFTDGWKESLLISDPDDPLTLECPDCDCEFEQGYVYENGIVTLKPEVTVTEHGDTWTDPAAATDEEEEEDDEDEEEEDGFEEEEDEEDDEEED